MESHKEAFSVFRRDRLFWPLVVIVFLCLSIFVLQAIAEAADVTPLKSGTVAPKEMQSGDIIANSFLDALVITATEIDTLAELEAIMSSINIIASTEIDTEAELEAIVAGINLLLNTEIDTYAELEALSNLPTITTNDIPYGSASNVWSVIPSYNVNPTNLIPSGAGGMELWPDGTSDKPFGTALVLTPTVARDTGIKGYGSIGPYAVRVTASGAGEGNSRP